MSLIANVPGQYQFTRSYQWRVGYSDAVCHRECAQDANSEYYDGFSKGAFDDNFINGGNSTDDTQDY